MATKKSNIIALITLLLVLLPSLLPASGGPRYRKGHVAAKGIVKSPDGNPYWVEYDDEGNVVAFIGEAADDLANSTLMSGDNYRLHMAGFMEVEALHSAHRLVLAREVYEARSFTNAADEPIEKPALLPSTRYVVVRTHDVLYSPQDLILYQSPLNLDLAKQIPADIRSVLLNQDGVVVHTAKVNIGYRVAFYSPLDYDPSEDPTVDMSTAGNLHMGSFNPSDNTLWGPIEGVLVESSLGRRGAPTNSDGRYSLTYYLPPCPGFAFFYDSLMMATLKYRSFNPNGKKLYTYYATAPDNDACSGYGDFGSYGFSLGGLLAQMSVMPIDNSIEGSTTMRTKNFPIDMAMLSGEADLRNSLEKKVLLQGQKTVYGYTAVDFQPLIPQGDIDGDGIIDHAELNAETNQISIWLGGADPEENPPALVRQADFNPDFTEQGLVKEVSHDDLRNTDTFLYRVSNGQLFSARNGLLGGETDQVAIGDVSNTTNTTIHYRQIIRGPRKTSTFQSDIEKWQASTNVNEELRGWQADHIRTGEQLKVVMINRATGYIGSSIATYGENTEQGGILSFTPEKIHMLPPNLKIKVERSKVIDAGLTAGQEHIYTIGFEGSGLTSDKYIVITTEWFDQDGSPLPEDLPGYTGRLAKVVEQNQLGQGAGQIVNFPILPGRNLVVVQLPQAEVDTAHYYVHVNGEAMEGQPDFATTADFTTVGAGEGALQYRPKHYVPVQVPLYDKDLTETAEKIRQQAIAGGADPTDLPEVDPIYQWPYRPEMQFTLMDLEVQALETTLDGLTAPIDILDSDFPFISSSENDVFGVTYSLTGPELPMLESFSQERDLVFGLGYEEAEALFGEDNLAEFNALELLSNLSPADLIALQLYQKGDEANVLWEFETPVLHVEVSEASPLLAGPSGYGMSHNGLGLGRHKFQNKFDDIVNVSKNYIDDYRFIQLFAKEGVAVDVTIDLLNNAEKHVATLFSESGVVDLNGKIFCVDYEQIKDLGIGDGLSSDEFFVKITVQETDNPETIIEYPLIAGELGETFQGDALGQIIVHDVKIQDGQLDITRKDVETKGRGPQFSFSRSYNNQTVKRVESTLGAGWRHSYDMVLSPISTKMYDGTPLPTFVVENRGKLLDKEDIPKDEEMFHWDAIQVNGTLFRWTSSGWVPERGRHGKLEKLDQKWVYTSKDGTKYIYGNKRPYFRSFEQRLLESIKDRNGNTMTLEYSKMGVLETVTDAVDRTFTFSYEKKASGFFGSNQRLISVTGPDDSVTGPDDIKITFEYNEKGLLSSVSQGDRKERYSYEKEQSLWAPIGMIYGQGADYNLVSVTDANDHTTNYTYYKFGEIDKTFMSFIEGIKDWEVVKSVIYHDKNHADFTISFLNGNQRIVKDLRGNDTIYTLNYFGNPLKIEEPEGRVTQMTWSIDEGKSDNVMTSKTDPSKKVTYEYDKNGNITKELTPTGSISSTWNEFSQPLSREDRNGVRQSWGYDTKGNLLKYTDGDTHPTLYTHFSTGEVRTKTDGLGNETSYEYDSHGNPKTVSGEEGSITRFEYDVRGRKIAETDPNDKTTTFGYDTFGNLLSLTRPEINAYSLPAGSSRSKNYTYDSVDNMLTESDHLGLTLTYTYTDRDQVETIKRNIGGEKVFLYDENGNLLSETDWKGVSTTHTYDELNQRKSTTNRLGHTMYMDYDLAGNLTQVTDYNGNVTDNEYDELDRLTDTYQPELDGVRGHIVYTYYNEADSKTNLKSVTDQEGNPTSYEYNGRYLKTSETDGNQNKRSWIYDGAGNVETETDKREIATTHTYDRQNRLVSSEKAGVTLYYQYDLASNRTQATDGRGIPTKTAYDSWNRPYKVTDVLDHEMLSEFDGAGNPVKTVDANGVPRSASYDKRGLQVSSTDGENKTTTAAYDLNGNPERTVDKRGTITLNSYDAGDRLLTTTEAKGDAAERVSEVLSRDNNGNLLQVKDYNGNITTTEYNGLNLVSKVTDAKSKFSTTDYYRTGWVKSVTDRRNHTTSYSYDGIGQQTGITDAKNQTIATTYDENGNVKTATDKRGIVSENFYDELNRLISTVKAGVTLVTNEYDENNNLTATIDANTNRTEMEYDELNRLVKTTFADTTTVANTYDNLSNILIYTDEEHKESTNTYDKENRLLTTTLAGETVTNSYDANGNLKTVKRPKGNSKTMVYDLLNRLTSVTDATLTTRYEYDDNSNLINIYDPLDNHVEYRYDSLNRKTHHIQYKEPENLSTIMAYDEEGNLTSLTDAKGQQFSYTYDELNRQVMATYPNIATPYLAIRSIETGYDENNNISSITEIKTGASGIIDSTTNVYDDFDRLTSSTQRGVSINYDYDDNGNRTLVSSANGSTTYHYDSRNRLQTAVADAATTIYAYTPDGKQKTISYPNGGKVVYSYYPTNRVETVENSVGETTISSFAYSYDPNGNRTEQVAVQDGGTITTSYSYDTLDRMTGYSESTGNMAAYTFEGYNRKTESITKDGTARTRTYTYDETNWLTKIDDTTPADPHVIDYSYDNNGNTIRKTVSTKPEEELNFSYDSRDQLVQTVRGPPSSQTVLGRYDYNAQSLRVRHLDSARGDVHYFYDDNAVLEEQRPDGDLLAQYRYGSRLLSLFDGASNQFYHYDGLGSTVNLTDEGGATRVSYTLDPWGSIDQQTGDSVNRQIFTGQEHDENTGLIYFGARFYDPDIARFISQDSYLGKPGTPPSLHRYLYAYSNPTVYIDPDGNIGVFIDGTGMDKDKTDRQKTNIGRLFDAYADGERIYREGVGSDWYTKYSLGGFSGAGGKERVEYAYEQLVIAYNRAKEEDRVIDIYGFSRGAAQARDLVNVIHERGIPNTYGKVVGYKEVLDFENLDPDEYTYKKVPVYEKFKNVTVRFLGLFDTVASTGWPGNDTDIGYNLAIPRDGFVENVYHAKAQHEYRGLFDSQSIKTSENEQLPAGWVEQMFRGAHSDVGNGYLPGEDGKSNELAKIPLNWMYHNASGVVEVKFRPLSEEDRALPLDLVNLTEQQIYNKYIHDSRYVYERWMNKKDRETFYPQPKNKNVPNIIPLITIENESGRQI